MPHPSPGFSTCISPVYTSRFPAVFEDWEVDALKKKKLRVWRVGIGIILNQVHIRRG